MSSDKTVIAAEAEIWQKSLIDAALDAVMIIDEDGYVLDFNPSAEETFGYKKEDVIGRLMSDLIVPPALRSSHTEGLARMKRTQIPRILGQRLELPAVRSDGTEFPVELIVVQVPVKPRPVYVGYIRDVSERRESEAALLASAKRFRSLADSAPLMIWLANTQGRVGWFNKSWLEFTGCILEDVIGNGWRDVMHRDDLERYMEAYEIALSQGTSFSLEFRLRHADGTYHWVLGNVAPTLHPDGSIAGFAGSCVDITSRRETEMALRLTQFAMDGGADAIFWVRSDGSLHYVNEQAGRSLGFTRDELLKRSVVDFLLELPEGDWNRHWERVKETQDLTFEAVLRRKDGSCFPVEIKVNHTEFEKQEFFCVVARDITIRQKSQADLAEAMRQAQAANLAKSEFLAIVSHEMRTPLNSILGAIELSLQDTVTAEQGEMLSMCHRSGVQLKRLINDMLDYSQIQTGKFSLQSRVMDIEEILDRVHTSFTGKTEEKKLELRWQVAREVPATVIGDGRRLSQVIENLLNNAVKFTDEGYVAFGAELETLSNESATLRFVVEDSGIGIDPDHRDRIFHRFEQVDSGPTREFGGVGLGLSICAQLVELMRGHINVEDSETGGSRFVFTATFDRLTEQQRQALLQSQQPTVGERGKLVGVHVLLAEDDPPSSLVAQKMLEGAGVLVTPVEDGLEAVEKFAENPKQFNAVFMDVMMPRLDGIEAAQRIRELQTDAVPIIAMTAQAMVGDRERILGSQFNAYIAKPIERQHLLATLQELLTHGSDGTDGIHSLESRKHNVDVRVFDLEGLRRRCDYDQELIVEIVALFGYTCDESISQLKAGVAENNVEDVVHAAHRLKGAVANMCAPKLFGICQRMEAISRSGNLPQAERLLEELQQQIDCLQKAFEEQNLL